VVVINVVIAVLAVFFTGVLAVVLSVPWWGNGGLTRPALSPAGWTGPPLTAGYSSSPGARSRKKGWQ